MRILITGAEQPLGRLVSGALEGEHELRLVTTEGAAADGGYRSVDLREPEPVAAVCEGIDGVLHLAPYARAAASNPRAERQVLDQAARGTFVLCHAARKAGVQRIVLASRLDLMCGYPADHLVDETWAPRPRTDAASLAPYMAELTLREFARAEPMVGVCLRLGELGDDESGTSPADAVAAVRTALTMDLAGRGHRWYLYHIGSTDRYPLGAADKPPLSFTRSQPCRP